MPASRTNQKRLYMLRVLLTLEEQAKLEAYAESKVWTSSHIARESLRNYLDNRWNSELECKAQERLVELQEARKAA